ncbi:hypothetical protein [Agrobacterium tumefaciens]|uniref:hypothetical protein n=1 Tax=Agrobacterium tumefaciens TaxID=358 RepID=UPI0015720258|nr:hypothetical protein [Agrobacterium tumefaciens]NTB05877.1 hypothetical protein [Agrobacterium tumefaciens]
MQKYFERNKRWIKPALVGAMLATAGLMVQIIDQKGGTESVTSWVAPLGIIIAGFGAGLGAMFTDTTSAYCVRFIGTAAGVAAFLHSVA